MSASHDSATSVHEIRVLRAVFLLRHGQQDTRTPGDLGGLTETGFRQAASAARRLSIEPIDRIVPAAFVAPGRLPRQLLASMHLSRSKPTRTCTSASRPFREARRSSIPTA